MKHTDIIALWPDTYALADDIGQRQDTVRKWIERKRIPPEVWLDLLETKVAKKNHITAVKLLEGLKKP